MRWWVLFALGVLLALVAQEHVQAQDIVDVLRHSQQMRLDAMPLAPDGPRAQAVQRSFEALRRTLPAELAVDLRVIDGGTLAETMHGHIVVANQSLADLPEGQRLFILAHELGHVAAAHWLQMGLVFTRWVPGRVSPETTDPVAEPLGREASALAYRQELEADAFAARLLSRIGLPGDDAVAALLLQGVLPDGPTHPSTRRRVAAVRASLASVEVVSAGGR
jgi:Zn-dependent protease with chaperone function